MVIGLILLQKKEECIGEWIFQQKEEHQYLHQAMGIIKRADNRSAGFRKHIRIDHGFGYTSLYAHLQKYNVRRGQ